MDSILLCIGLCLAQLGLYCSPETTLTAQLVFHKNALLNLFSSLDRKLSKVSYDAVRGTLGPSSSRAKRRVSLLRVSAQENNRDLKVFQNATEMKGRK